MAEKYQSVDGWYRHSVIIHGSQVPSSLENFPVYLNLSEFPQTFWQHVAEGGGDIRIVASDLETELAREVVSCIKSESRGEVHFLADVLMPGSDTNFYLYYGKQGADVYSDGSSFGTYKVWSAYNAVYHLNGWEGSGLIKNSASALFQGSSHVDSKTGLLGQVGREIIFYGQAGNSSPPYSGDHFTVNSLAPLFFAGNFHAEVWQRQSLFEMMPNSAETLLSIQCSFVNSSVAGVYDEFSEWQLVTAPLSNGSFVAARVANNITAVFSYDPSPITAVVSISAWTNPGSFPLWSNYGYRYLAGQLDLAGSEARIFYNGSCAAVTSSAIVEIENATSITLKAAVGRHATLDDFSFGGGMDELRISNALPSSAWIMTTFLNHAGACFSDSMFYSVFNARVDSPFYSVMSYQEATYNIYGATAWLYQQLRNNRALSPVRRLHIGTSDYSDRVMAWPKLSRMVNDIKNVPIKIKLANTDGALNRFYEQPWTLQDSVAIAFGLTHPTSGEELITLYSGTVHKVSYDEKICEINARNKFYLFDTRRVGDSQAPVTMSNKIPSFVGWTLCTCYGGLSSVESTNNPDIDYASFLDWAAVFSADSVLCSVRYEGATVTEAVNRLAEHTGSSIWAGGNGKVYFKRFADPSSIDVVFSRDENISFKITLDAGEVLNRCLVGFDYSTASDYWTKHVVSVNTTSINSFGLRENYFRDDTVWYVDSTSALTLANRQVMQYNDPPKRFKVGTGLNAILIDVGETVKLVEPFFNITSASGWVLAEQEIDLDNAVVTYRTDETLVLNPFILDVSSLDGDDLLL